MRFVSGPPSIIEEVSAGTIPILLYGRSSSPAAASAGAAIAQAVRRQKLSPAAAAWDLLSVALSVVTADTIVKRAKSPDGWTRQLELQVAVSDPEIWNSRRTTLESMLGFLTTDVWMVTFVRGTHHPQLPRAIERPAADSVALLSGGLDSLIGALDLHADGEKLFAVSHTVRGDRKKQDRFARAVRTAAHLQVNHNANMPRHAKETSQRSRSLIFLALAVLAATATQRYADGDVIPVYICENGFIAINVPLTGARLGSLSTRTAHPHFLGEFQHLVNELGLRIELRNPYAERTKGEMLSQCRDQDTLGDLASDSTSCGRFLRYNYMHCGRCIPCQIRRAAFLASKQIDTTPYFFEDLGHLQGVELDDVRSVAMARLVVEDQGLDRWIGSSLTSPHIHNGEALRSMIQRGLDELGALHARFDIS
ncbi:Qat anti-phage system QueC-like protein QatC [Promicromonospora sp. NPDC050880]|uniref:Qat anti-phage system QueC-like protein QatC n=1 Tax=Promicromonospora sp. NPDC050880 TaxID=3364406 RepID=UPI0037A204CD